MQPAVLIGRGAGGCPHIRAGRGGAAVKEGGGRDNKVCDIVETTVCLSDRFLLHAATEGEKGKKQTKCKSGVNFLSQNDFFVRMKLKQ